jgi:molecular chaperone DnaK
VSFRVPPVLGIDLGTTNTVAAAFAGDGRVQVIKIDGGDSLLPSVVSFPPTGETLIGDAARVRRIIDARNTIYSSKRIIGQSFRAPKVAELIASLPYRVIEGNRQEPMIQTRAGIHTVPQIASLILGRVVAAARNQTGAPLQQCVITVPANFADGQRQATRQAAELAGLEVLRILNEPTAAAVAYGHQSRQGDRIAVFDMGGGTFDLTVLAIRDGIFEVIATGGDSFLGGDDMDRALAEHLALGFLERHRIDLRSDPETFARLIMVAEDIKRRLTETVLVEDSIREIAYGLNGMPLDLEFRLRRERFESLIVPLIDRSIEVAARVLGEADLLPGQLDALILVGGATRVPLVQRRLQERFGLVPRCEIDPLEVVAMGAAMQAVRLVAPPSDDAEPPLLIDVTSHALGIATTAGFVEHLIPKNTPIPAEGRQVFTTAKDNQTAVKIRVCQGASRHFVDNVAVGELQLRQLRPAPRGEVKVEVSFLIDADGTLSVSAQDMETGRSEQATLELIGVDLQPAPESSPPPVPRAAGLSDPELPSPTG